MPEDKLFSAKRFVTEAIRCPSCEKHLDRDDKWCPRCGFTGAATIDLFGDKPPPLLPILDATGAFSENDAALIQREIQRNQQRFPQFEWRVCTATPGVDASLPLFGFWLLNVCPLLPEETVEQRQWCVLLLIDEPAGRVAVATGYLAETWLPHSRLESALAAMREPMLASRQGQAVADFLATARAALEDSWALADKTRRRKPSRP
jgi:hypothetical protein